MQEGYNILIDWDGVIVKNPNKLLRVIVEGIDVHIYSPALRSLFDPLYRLYSYLITPIPKNINTLRKLEVEILTENPVGTEKAIYKFARQLGLNVKEVITMPSTYRDNPTPWLINEVYKKRPAIYITNELEGTNCNPYCAIIVDNKMKFKRGSLADLLQTPSQHD
jgi:hypothetical protein